jgi:hypothetical protein
MHLALILYSFDNHSTLILHLFYTISKLSCAHTLLWAKTILATHAHAQRV